MARSQLTKDLLTLNARLNVPGAWCQGHLFLLNEQGEPASFCAGGHIFECVLPRTVNREEYINRVFECEKPVSAEFGELDARIEAIGYLLCYVASDCNVEDAKDWRRYITKFNDHEDMTLGKLQHVADRALLASMAADNKADVDNIKADALSHAAADLDARVARSANAWGKMTERPRLKLVASR